MWSTSSLSVIAAGMPLPDTVNIVRKPECDPQVWSHWPVALCVALSVALSGLVNLITCSTRPHHDVICLFAVVTSWVGMHVTCWGAGSGSLLGDCSKETVLLVILEVNGCVQLALDVSNSLYLWFLSLVLSNLGFLQHCRLVPCMIAYYTLLNLL